MRRWASPWLPAIWVCALLVAAGRVGGTGQAPAAPVPGAVTPRAERFTLDQALLRWPLPAGEERYGAIDGKRMHAWVVEQAQISRRYRDQGHPKFWGRITGTSSDQESAEWLAAKFKGLGLSDVRIQPLDLEPQWMPQTWEVTVSAGGKTIRVDSAQPHYGANGLPAGGVKVDAVYVGLGSEADFAGRDVQGRAVLVFNQTGLRNEGAVRRADDKGAAVILEVDMLPGNMRYQAYPSGTKAPAFELGSDDGYAVRDLIAALPAGQRATVSATLEVQRVPNLKTALVWGTLKGSTDETIYLIAHRDGWFDAIGRQCRRRRVDHRPGRVLREAAAGAAPANAGVRRARRAPQLGHRRRRRASVDVGQPGDAVHQDRADDQRRAPLDHSDDGAAALRSRTGSPGATPTCRSSGTRADRRGGSSRRIAVNAFRQFGASIYLDPNPRPPAGDLGAFFRGVPGVATSEFYHYFHTDAETPGDGALDRPGSVDARLREDHRRGEQAAAERPATARGAAPDHQGHPAGRRSLGELPSQPRALRRARSSDRPTRLGRSVVPHRQSATYADRCAPSKSRPRRGALVVVIGPTHRSVVTPSAGRPSCD